MFFSRSIYKKIFYLKNNIPYHTNDFKIYDRGSCIPSQLVGKKLGIYRGNKLIWKTPSRWHLGFNYGELTWTRKIALFKAKQLKKKKK